MRKWWTEHYIGPKLLSTFLMVMVLSGILGAGLPNDFFIKVCLYSTGLLFISMIVVLWFADWD